MLRILIFGLCLLGGLHSQGLRLKPPIPDHRIVGGQKCNIADHPHQLSLQTSGHICGASIISTKWVITAAHCVGSSASTYKVSAGSANKNNGTIYRIKRVVRHPNYNRNDQDFDFALLEVNGEIKLNSRTVKAVRLAQKELEPNVMVNVTGWGATNENSGSPTELMRVSIPIVHRTVCSNAYRQLHNITQRMICAGYISAGGKDSCQGDSGGPLTAGDVLYGIVSWGYGCARPKYPGVYSNVASVRTWIKSITGL